LEGVVLLECKQATGRWNGGGAVHGDPTPWPEGLCGGEVIEWRGASTFCDDERLLSWVKSGERGEAAYLRARMEGRHGSVLVHRQKDVLRGLLQQLRPIPGVIEMDVPVIAELLGLGCGRLMNVQAACPGQLRHV
jgi:hypothetical protein